MQRIRACIIIYTQVNNTSILFIEAMKRRVNNDFIYRELGQVKASVKRFIEHGLGAFYLK